MQAAWCPALDNAFPASGLVGKQDRILEYIAKYRPHRPHGPQSADFQRFRAGGIIAGIEKTATTQRGFWSSMGGGR
jgi:hypothetical protein